MGIFHIFDQYHIVADFSTKADGQMRLRTAMMDNDWKNREQYLRKIGIAPVNLVSATLCHSQKVKVVTVANSGQIINDHDGLVTADQGIFLSITAADCLPIFFFDPMQKIVGLIHAGWRGLAKGIINQLLDKFQNKGSLSKNLLVGIGPSICQQCFEVDESVARQFGQFDHCILKSDKNHLAIIAKDSLAASKSMMYLVDLRQIAFNQLVTAGIQSNYIEINPECTCCTDHKYFSYRRDKPEEVQAQMAVLGMKK